MPHRAAGRTKPQGMDVSSQGCWHRRQTQPCHFPLHLHACTLLTGPMQGGSSPFPTAPHPQAWPLAESVAKILVSLGEHLWPGVLLSGLEG